VDSLVTDRDLFEKIQEEIQAWGNLLIETGGCLKSEQCLWYLLNYDCVDGVWMSINTAGYELLIPSDCGPPPSITSLDVYESGKIVQLVGIRRI
jgi:hypothetical protein